VRREAFNMKVIFIALAVGSLCACGGGYGSTAPSNNGVNTTPPVGGITVSNNVFSPAAKTVAVGTTVEWAWNSCTGDPYTGQTCGSHSVTFDDGTTSATQSQGTYSRMFSTAGTYAYHCSVHPTMTGTITVQ
jgi:plastocyanin